MLSFLSPKRAGAIRVWRNGAFCVGPNYIFAASCFLSIIAVSTASIALNNMLMLRILCGTSAFLSLGFMWLCSTSDPGICPWRTREEMERDTKNGVSKGKDAELVTFINKNGEEESALLRCKWCYTCNQFRPLRAVHCSYCGVCILRRDHHCPWVGTCVGERNYRFYWFFLWSVTCLSLTVLVSGVWGIAIRVARLCGTVFCTEKSMFVSAFGETHYIEPTISLVALISCAFVAPLAVYHAMLVTKNMTTGEELNCDGVSVHYFSRGGCVANVKASLCSPIPPSIFQEGVSSLTPLATAVVMVEEAEV
ncbi:palmitoyl acyltransferase 10, putative [Trypanosoma equiperdum]|uniref:Palmitoyltransferase n=4 Tax=Trypanozoon TaxID=39700 RepID=Q582V3_TRYB2|nr:hypothetical protein, conserved [Trypanosoma brucei gambiense DAL972]XP_843834.1 hypothetical protein, conserved [Trypanosoma brucei brucei TREU927]AAX80679.1 hypothetical protein, conserved [Trypanosoma brucei]RHW73576.1 palmitoyl acyltransferase 10 [Trypanosoma brucei equiperdum]SCU70632.1 palmitoyl acyltransferase 10, putative [Trypanosoma equiperdum]AAZ10275.1 hypothetical protein, conserved [Trypanosoma brucei brucei TREU927]CBH09900.1 hypothetical protein, conserved [Trypanosoma bruc|eukprot:XP_011772193.1 hypothetical protein, conserved [Trypanosoma brucei gambiense DAL972]